MDVNHNKLINTLISLLYSALKVDEHTTNSYNLTSAEWDSLYKLATTQGILAIVYEAVSQLPKEQQPPRHLKLQWALGTEKIKLECILEPLLCAPCAAVSNLMCHKCNL